MKIPILLAVSIALLCSAIGCGDDATGVGNDGALVGGPCAIDEQCAPSSRCLLSGDFPGGTCSVACKRDGDCPQGTSCIDKDGGICLLNCLEDEDCRPGYSCYAESIKGGGSDKAAICIQH